MENKNETSNKDNNSALHKTSVSRSDFEIYDRDWKTFDEEEPPTETPVWLKLHNNNVVLAAYAHNGMGATGWWKVVYDTESMEWKMNPYSGYLTKQTVWQPCPLFWNCG